MYSTPEMYILSILHINLFWVSPYGERLSSFTFFFFKLKIKRDILKQRNVVSCGFYEPAAFLTALFSVKQRCEAWPPPGLHPPGVKADCVCTSKTSKKAEPHSVSLNSLFLMLSEKS